MDHLIHARFAELHEQARQGDLFTWRDTPRGRLAEIILLDQFSRNLYRDSAKAFAQDPMALALSQEAIRLKADQKLPIQQRGFLYLPFMHSESAMMHEQAVQLFSAPGMEGNLDFELKHKTVIDQFGRYPHRNALLNRKSTPEELAFLEKDGAGR